MTIQPTNAASDEVVTIDGVDYRVLVWTGNGSFSVTDTVDVEYLVVAGGGGGGSRFRGTGGGGAGGLKTNVGSTLLTIPSGAYDITVGAGGAGGASNTNNLGVSGSPSSIDSLIVTTGGGGGGSPSSGTGLTGGSGGGGGSESSSVRLGGAGVSGEGHDGGDAHWINIPGGNRAGGGGGGAGGPGVNGVSQVGGDGGPGVVSSITGTAVGYAGGGGGGVAPDRTAGSATHGGGAGSTDGAGQNGVDGTGGGGGGGAENNAGGKGGDGVVVIRFAIAQGSGSGDVGSGSGDVTDPEPDLPESSIFGEVGIIGRIRFGVEISIEGRVGVAAILQNPLNVTEGLDGTPKTPIIGDLVIEPPFTPEVSAPVPGSQSAITDRVWYGSAPRKTVVVTMSGEVEDDGFLSTASHGDITWTRSNSTQWQVSIPLNSPEAKKFLSDQTEIGVTQAFKELQLWRGKRLLVWGPVVSMAVNNGALELTGSDPSWYLSRRFVGPAGPTNLMPDTRILPGLPGWIWSVFKGWDNPEAPNEPGLNVTAARLPRNRSQFAIRIEDRNPIYNNDPDCEGFVSFPNALQIAGIPRQRVNTTIEFSCFVHVENLLSRNDDSGSIGIGLFPFNARSGLRDLIDVQWAQLGDDFPVGVRQRLSVSMNIPANRNVFAVLMVRGPKGVSFFWDFDLQWDGGLINVNEDKATIATKLVDHLSGNPSTRFRDAKRHPLQPYLGPETYGKSDVNIGTSIRRTGIRVDRVYPFNDSGSGLNLISDILDDEDSVGWQMLYRRNRRDLHRLRVDGVRWDCRLWHTRTGGNILSDPVWQFMGEQAANVVRVTSSQGSTAVGIPDSQANRLRRIFPDVPHWDATIEDVSQAPQDLQDERLNEYAFDRLWATTRPVSLSVTISAKPFFTERNLNVSDVIPVSINYGNLRVVGFYRVYQMTLKTNDTLELVLTPTSKDNTNL